jgi:hypothetical protein
MPNSGPEVQAADDASEEGPHVVITAPLGVPFTSGNGGWTSPGIA